MMKSVTRFKRALFAPLFLSSFTLCAEKTAVFILGAPRSGTSAVAGGLKIMDLQLGKNLSKPQSWNPKGDFEDQATICLNKVILQQLNMSPYDKEAKRIDLKDPGMRRYIDIVKSHLSIYFGGYEVYGIKHPKMCLLLPFYIQAAKELGYKVKLIIVKRKPLDIVRSLNNTTKQMGNLLDVERGAAYVNSFLTAIDAYASEAHDSITVTFDDVMTKTRETFESLARFVPGLYSYVIVETEVNNFLGKPTPKKVIAEGAALSDWSQMTELVLKEWVCSAR
jgi:hypothetical protein